MRLVVLLRGVNVGGTGKVVMADLRHGLEAAGCVGVATYIQSGNIVVTPPDHAADDVHGWLERTIADIAGFDVPVVTRTPAELERVVERNPYPTDDGTTVHVTFFGDAPGPGLIDGLDMARFAPDECTLIGRELYLSVPNGMARTKLPVAIERAGRNVLPPAIGTTRNWNTVSRLLELTR